MRYTSTFLSVAALSLVVLGALEDKNFRIMPLGGKSIFPFNSESTNNFIKHLSPTELEAVLGMVTVLICGT